MSPAHERNLFDYEVRRDGRPVVLLQGAESKTGAVVECAVFPVTGMAGQDPVQRSFSFATTEQARRFVDEALTTLEYASCSVQSR